MTPQSTGIPTLDTFLQQVEQQILNPIIDLLVLAAFIIFVWGVVQYIANAADDEKRKQGAQHILWGIIGLVIIFAAAAIVQVISATAQSIF